MLALSLVITCRQATVQESSRVNGTLHGYQQQVLDHVLQNQRQNYIIVAPTASGKTRIPIEVAGALLRRKPTAKILFLSPTVALTEQQTGRRVRLLDSRSGCLQNTQLQRIPFSALRQSISFVQAVVQHKPVCA